MKHLVFSFSFFALIVLSSASKYTDCGSITGEVSSVQVTDCTDSQDECPLKKGTIANITIIFTSKADTKSLTAVVFGVIAGVPIPFHVPHPDACEIISCPVKNGQKYTYEKGLVIRQSYPSLAVKVRYELKDENEKLMVCVEIPCKIQ